MIIKEHHDGLIVGQKVTLYTLDGKAHTGFVAEKLHDDTATLRVRFSAHGEAAVFYIPFASILYWCEYLDGSGDPIMEQP